MLSLALTVYEAGLCKCGQPMIFAHHPDNDGWYDAKTSQCHSCAAQEIATAPSGNEPYKPDPGEKMYTVYTRPAHKPLPPVGG